MPYEKENPSAYRVGDAVYEMIEGARRRMVSRRDRGWAASLSRRE